MTITIEHLKVMFDAQRERDEIRFRELFDRCIAQHDQERDGDRTRESQAASERAVGEGRAAW